MIKHYRTLLAPIAARDAARVEEKDKQYGSSWKKRGGVGAFMMLARKWDRIEELVEKHFNWDLFAAIESDHRPEAVIDDIRDLRRYLLLVEAEMTARGGVVLDGRLPEADVGRKPLDVFMGWLSMELGLNETHTPQDLLALVDRFVVEAASEIRVDAYAAARTLAHDIFQDTLEIAEAQEVRLDPQQTSSIQQGYRALTASRLRELRDLGYRVLGAEEVPANRCDYADTEGHICRLPVNHSGSHHTGVKYGEERCQKHVDTERCTLLPGHEGDCLALFHVGVGNDEP